MVLARRRVLKALLYMLDQGPASAPTLTESIKIRAAAQSDDAGTAVWAPSGSSVQVEMVLQLWAELIGIYAK